MSTLRYSRREIGSSPAPAITKWSDNEPLGRGFRRKQRVSKSPTPNPKSLKPKISLTRLTPIASSDDGTPTKFTLKDLNRVASSYPWPEGVTLCLPVEDGGSLAKYEDSLVVHEASLKAGFRVPVAEFVREFLSWTRLCPAQISPNSWRCVSAYGIRCWEVKKAATFEGMKYLFEMREKEGVFNVCTSNPDVMPKLSSGLRGWKNKWFLVRKGGGYDFDFPVHPGIGVKFSKGASEISEVSGEEKELMDAFVSLEWTNRNGSKIVTDENLEKAGLSLPHPRQSKKHGKVRSIKFVFGKRNGLHSSRSVEASRKRALASRSMASLLLEKDEERPTKKRLNSVPLVPESPILKLHMPTDSPDGRPNNLASSLTLEEANGLFKEANVNVEQASAEFSRAVTLQVYHANKLIEKHEKLLSSHLASHAKLEGLQEENKELKKELLCARESAKRSEESMTKKIQSLEDKLAKTQEKNAEKCHKILVLEMDLSKEREKRNGELLSAKLNEEKMKSEIQSLEDKLKKTQEENDNILKKRQEKNFEMYQKMIELETDLSKVQDKWNDELVSSKRNEEKMKNEIKSLEDKLKKTQEQQDNILKKAQDENGELCRKIMELEPELSKAREKRNDELLKSKLKEEKMKNEIQSLEDKLKETQEEKANNLKKAQEENGKLCRKIMELEADLSRVSKKGKEESRNEERAKKQIQSLEGILKKTREENDEQLRMIMKLKSDLSKAKDIGKEELLDLKLNEKSMKEQFEMLENKFMETQKDNVGLCQTITELKSDLSKAKDIGKEELLESKSNEKTMKEQCQMLENKLKQTQKENSGLCHKILELEMDLSDAKHKGRKEFLDSNGFYRRVAHFNSTYYTSGMRVGVCQAVKKYQHLDPKIVEFEPDFDDDCGYEVPDPPPYSSPIRLVPSIVCLDSPDA